MAGERFVCGMNFVIHVNQRETPKFLSDYEFNYLLYANSFAFEPARFVRVCCVVFSFRPTHRSVLSVRAGLMVYLGWGASQINHSSIIERALIE
jgi:hypothetical protein